MYARYSLEDWFSMIKLWSKEEKAVEGDENTGLIEHLPQGVQDKINSMFQNEGYDFEVYRVIPHTNTLNSASRNFQRSLYELLNFKEGVFPWERSEKFLSSFALDNLYINLRKSPSFWWIVVIEATEGGSNDESESTIVHGDADLGSFSFEDDLGYAEETQAELVSGESATHSISYYVSIPKEFAANFEIKFFNHNQWSKCSLKKAIQMNKPQTSNLKEDKYVYKHPPLENTDLYSFRYARNNMFSLEYDYSEQHTPIYQIMGLVRELSEGESIYFMVKHEAIPRKRWQSLGDYAWSVWEKGGVPARNGLDSVVLKEYLAKTAGYTLTYTTNLIEDILVGLRGSFFYSGGEREYKTFHFDSSIRKQLLINGDLSKRTKYKRVLPSLKAHILVTVTSKDKAKRDMLSRAMENALSPLNGDNYLVRTQVKNNLTNELKKLRTFSNDYRNPNIMSIEELGKITQLPTSELQREFSDYLVYNKRMEVKIGGDLVEDNGILVGTVTDRGEVFDVRVQRKNLDFASTARAVLGSPRMGKDQHIINYVIESKLNHNMGAVVLDVINEQDGHRGMADSIRDHLPPEEVIDINLQDFSFPPYLGLAPIIQLIGDARIASDRVAEELCSFLLTDGDENKLQTTEYLREASKLADADLLSIKHIFTSKGYRDELRRKKEGVIDTDIWDYYDNLSDKQQEGIYTPIMRRLGQIVTSEYLKPIFCQEANTNLDLAKFIEEGKVIIFRMKTGIMPRRVVEILCYWITLITMFVKYALGGGTEKNGGTNLILNEPHQYMTNELSSFLERLFAEGPKYKLVPILIFHNFEQFRKYRGFVDIMKSASLNWHLFHNTNSDVYKELFPYLSKTFETPQQAFESTKKYQFIGIWMDKDGAYHDPFLADSLPMAHDRVTFYDNSHLTLEHSKLFGRPIDEVLEEIKERNRYAKSIANPESDETEEPEEEKKPTPSTKKKHKLM